MAASLLHFAREPLFLLAFCVVWVCYLLFPSVLFYFSYTLSVVSAEEEG